jgi:hypothetical protein
LTWNSRPVCGGTGVQFALERLSSLRGIRSWPPISITNAAFDLGERSWNTSDKANAKSRVNNHWKKLGANLAISRDHILKRGADFGLFLEPRNEVMDEEGRRNPKGGRGKKARYCLLFFPMPTQGFVSSKKATSSHDTVERPDMLYSELSAKAKSTSEQHNDLPATAPDGIQYYPIPLALPRLLRLFPADGLSMGGWAGRLLTAFMTGPGIAVLLLALMNFLLVFYASSVIVFLRMTLVSVVLVIMVRGAFGWWWNLIQNSVARAPLWWQSLSFGDNVIERRLDPNGLDPARLHLVRYVADCPLCGTEGPGRSAVRLDSGRLEFFGRIVGRCRHAPNEHVWSFDHITQRGSFLR